MAIVVLPLTQREQRRNAGVWQRLQAISGAAAAARGGVAAVELDASMLQARWIVLLNPFKKKGCALSKVREERIKLFATYLNTMAAGSFIAGFVAPLVTLAAAHGAGLFPAATFPLIFVALSIALHLVAQITIGSLEK